MEVTREKVVELVLLPSTDEDVFIGRNEFHMFVSLLKIPLSSFFIEFEGMGFSVFSETSSTTKCSVYLFREQCNT